MARSTDTGWPHPTPSRWRRLNDWGYAHWWRSFLLGELVLVLVFASLVWRWGWPELNGKNAVLFVLYGATHVWGVARSWGLAQNKRRTRVRPTAQHRSTYQEL